MTILHSIYRWGATLASISDSVSGLSSASLYASDWQFESALPIFESNVWIQLWSLSRFKKHLWTRTLHVPAVGLCTTVFENVECELLYRRLVNIQSLLSKAVKFLSQFDMRGLQIGPTSATLANSTHVKSRSSPRQVSRVIEAFITRLFMFFYRFIYSSPADHNRFAIVKLVFSVLRKCCRKLRTVLDAICLFPFSETCLVLQRKIAARVAMKRMLWTMDLEQGGTLSEVPEMSGDEGICGRSK